MGIISFRYLLKYDILKLFICTFLSVLVLGIDGILQLKNVCISNNRRRLITGLLCGFFLMCFIIRIILELIAEYSGT